jgi:hypothetical protein
VEEGKKDALMGGRDAHGWEGHARLWEGGELTPLRDLMCVILILKIFQN